MKALLLCLTLSLLLSVYGVGCGTGRPPVKTLEQCWRIAWRRGAGRHVTLGRDMAAAVRREARRRLGLPVDEG